MTREEQYANSIIRTKDANILEMYNSGMTFGEIAKYYGFSRQRAAQIYYRASGIKPVKEVTYYKERNEKIYEERKTGKSLGELSEKYGISKWYICNITSKLKKQEEQNERNE